jgi:hypothetical protein
MLEKTEKTRAQLKQEKKRRLVMKHLRTALG